MINKVILNYYVNMLKLLVCVTKLNQPALCNTKLTQPAQSIFQRRNFDVDFQHFFNIFWKSNKNRRNFDVEVILRFFDVESAHCVSIGMMSFMPDKAAPIPGIFHQKFILFVCYNRFEFYEGDM